MNWLKRFFEQLTNLRSLDNIIWSVVVTLNVVFLIRGLMVQDMVSIAINGLFLWVMVRRI